MSGVDNSPNLIKLKEITAPSSSCAFRPSPKSSFDACLKCLLTLTKALSKWCFYFGRIWLLGFAVGLRTCCWMQNWRRCDQTCVRTHSGLKYLTINVLVWSSRIPKEECSSSASRTRNQEDSLSLFLLPSHKHTNIHSQTKTHTPCCCVTLAQLLTDIMLGNTLGTVWEAQKQVRGTKWLEYWVTSKQKPALTENYHSNRLNRGNV